MQIRNLDKFQTKTNPPGSCQQQAPRLLPGRVYVPLHRTAYPGPKGEQYFWYQCTVKGGREGRPMDAVTLAKACEEPGTGEILLNCIDRDGTNSGFDLELINGVCDNVTIPVIASSGAGCAEHFFEVLRETDVESALAAGIFHRREVPIEDVKKYLAEKNIEIRQ